MSLADEWFADFIHRCEEAPKWPLRQRNRWVDDPGTLEIRAYAEGTTHFLKYLRRQHELGA